MTDELIKFDEEPNKWMALHKAGESNLITAIFQLRRIGYSDEEIERTLRIFMGKTKAFKTSEAEKK